VGPAWALSKWEGYRIIIASYATKIAAKQSRKTRALCRQPRHVAIWPDRPILANDQKAVDQWALSNNSEFMAAGILAGITGNRADGIVLDDPIAGREAADSEVIREKTYDEYIDSITTRLKPNGWIALVQTRWHEDDLAGRILPEDYAGESGRILCRDGQYWTVVNIPAKAERTDDPLGREPGEYLWPEWFPARHWSQWEHNPRASRTWSALYQQRPTAGEGIEFKREWFKWYDPDVAPGKPGGRPVYLTHYSASDYATKEDKGDFTEHGIVGVGPATSKEDLLIMGPNDKPLKIKTFPFYFLDWWYGQKTTDVSIANWIALQLRWAAKKHWNEGGPIDNAISPALKQAQRECEPNPIHIPIESLTSIKNKAIKLASFQARAAAGLVYFPLNRPWATRVVDQLCAFPAGKYDDAADVCGLLGRGVDAMMSPHASVKSVRPQLTPFTGDWVESSDPELELKVRYS
jgi:predicted phage terminase large subunit-like protein